MSLINRLLLPIAPKLAFERELWALRARGFYSAADTSPRSGGWTTTNANGEQVNQGSRDIIRARSRDLERNSDILAGQILALERNVVGTGFVLQAKVLKSDGEENETLNTEIEEHWREWCRPQHCEITGRFSLSELVSMCLRRRFVDGGILLLLIVHNQRLTLQLLEVDDLDTSIQRHGENRVVGGIEIDSYRCPVAYHIKIYDDWGYAVKSTRIPADRVIYLPYITRPSQIREMPPVAPSLARVDDVNELIDAALEKERVLSHLSVVVEKAGSTLTGLQGVGRGAEYAPQDAGQSAAPQEILDQGTVTYLNPGEKISTVAPAGTSSTVDPMVKTTQRLAGGGVGLSYETVSRDMSQVNYSSARQGLLEDQKTYRGLQKYLVDHLLDVIYPLWLDLEVLSGRLALPDYFRRPAPYRRHIWITAGWDWIDPNREANANKTSLETGQKTLQEICAEKGKDWRDVVRQRAAEIKLMAELNGQKGDDEIE